MAKQIKNQIKSGKRIKNSKIMNINDFKFYRKNNRYYFESELLEGRVYMKGKMLKGVSIENEGYSPYEQMKLQDKEDELFDLFNDNIAAVIAAEEV